MIRWIRQNKDRKFYAAYLTEFPHHPYLSFEATKPFPDDTWLNRYRNSLHYADSAVGRLLDFLRKEGLLDKTLIVVVGDHGETVSKYPVGHGLHVSVEELRTPFFLSNPKLFPKRVQSKLMTSHIDVPPTLVEHARACAAAAEWLGRNLLAEQIPAAMHFVTMPHSRKIGVIDHGAAVRARARNGTWSCSRSARQQLKRVPANDPRPRAQAGVTGRRAEWYAGVEPVAAPQAIADAGRGARNQVNPPPSTATSTTLKDRSQSAAN